MNRFDWLYRYAISCFQCKLLGKVMNRERFCDMRTQYFKRYIGNFAEINKANELLKEWIALGKPFAVTRNGMEETAMFVSLAKTDIIGGDSFLKHDMSASFNKEKEQLMQYYDILKGVYQDSDIICVWHTLCMEEYVMSRYGRNAIKTRVELVHAFNVPGCWIQALKGKKVLVVSPFSDTIESQYPKRELLHKEKDTLPEITLSTVKAVWWYSHGRDPRFQTWFEVLDYMFEECMKQDFDVALLSCGTFGAPLAVRLKRAGKQAVQMGGGLQLLFGIKGKRWDDVPGLYNEYWVRLPEETKFGNVNVLDQTPGGAYW